MSSSETTTRREDTSPPWTLRDQMETGTKSRSWCARSQSMRRKEDVRIPRLEAYANCPMPNDNPQGLLQTAVAEHKVANYATRPTTSQNTTSPASNSESIAELIPSLLSAVN